MGRSCRELITIAKQILSKVKLVIEYARVVIEQ